MHDQASHDVREAEEATQAASSHAAQVARSSASQQEHDARMMNVAAGSVAAVRQVLEAEVRRARIFGWTAVGVAITAALASISIAVLTDRASQAAERRSQHRLLEEKIKRISLEGELAAQEGIGEALRLGQQRDYESLQATQARLSQTLGLLGDAQAELGAALRNGGHTDERSRLADTFVTREEHQHVWELLHVVLDGLVARPDPPKSAPGYLVDVEEPDATPRAGPIPARKSRRPTFALLSVKQVTPISVLGDGGADTHDWYMNGSGDCTTP